MPPATHLEVLSTPNEFCALTADQIKNTTCVVFDILRATTSMITALAHGAQAIRPVSSIQQALQVKQDHPHALLCGERHGLRITTKDSGNTNFDFGNSPREFNTPAIHGKELIVTTTNGTRALHAARPAHTTLVSSFLNLTATAQHIRHLKPQSLLIIGAGTYEEAALEDTLAAGALCHALWDIYSDGHVADSALMARMIYQTQGSPLIDGLSQSRNGKRLLTMPDLQADVAFAAQQDQFPILAQLNPDGWIRPTTPL
ncbi:MAG: hypothetical protein RI897_3738 [Verrucomicrobiota bacterium]|jgi:2-phosphosulfolactate phosphatase